ncbi:polysaccharide deacetylase family protein [Pseudonocardia sp. KRD291]|uniref:polysaccharide deacetylase family protein n=1 Tax=Pseudonocardia sp. KRD291 TaxID=2792007 RepID=UPI0027E21C92|nr:polysaccharide deacetylase family protein [Pseudonocardia sp. KRD291]
MLGRLARDEDPVGEFGAEVGVPRLLSLYKRYGVRTTWFTPGHSIDTFPEQCKKVLDDGHEFGHHGYYHENPTMISGDTERRLVDLAFATFKTVLGSGRSGTGRRTGTTATPRWTSSRARD